MPKPGKHQNTLTLLCPVKQKEDEQKSQKQITIKSAKQINGKTK
jgi:hypothetical protein